MPADGFGEVGPERRAGMAAFGEVRGHEPSVSRAHPFGEVPNPRERGATGQNLREHRFDRISLGA